MIVYKLNSDKYAGNRNGYIRRGKSIISIFVNISVPSKKPHFLLILHICYLQIYYF